MITTSPPASNTLMWGKCLTLACSNSRSRVSCSLIKLINNYNYNYNNNVEHVDVWQAAENRHYTKRWPRWWQRRHRPCHLIARRDIVTPIQSTYTAFSVEHVKVWQGGVASRWTDTLLLWLITVKVSSNSERSKYAIVQSDIQKN